jgi:long-subunit acyl-CoA synthetase (AMP-forming)
MTPSSSAPPRQARLPGAGARTLPEAFQASAALAPERTALRARGGAGALSWRAYDAWVRGLAGGLAGLGVGRGDTVAIMLSNRPEMFAVDAAALHLGAIPFSIYNSSPVEQIAPLLANAGSRVAVTERRFLEPLLEARPAALEHVVLVDGDAPGTIALESLWRRSAELDFERAWRAVAAEDVAVLVYTSGTTGDPKGVQLTHANVLAVTGALTELLPIPAGCRGISWLPFAHIADRLFAHYLQIHCAGTVTVLDDAALVLEALPDARPDFWAAVPRPLEKLMANLRAAGLEDPGSLSASQRLRVRAAIGLDRARWLSSGAAPIAAEVLEFFAALGLPVCEAWGMSELVGVGTINRLDEIRVGTVGKPLPGVDLRLGGDGELFVRGPGVMLGYRGDPARTAAALDDGWLRTGDLAAIDADGFVRIVGRKKELIVTSYGKNISPVGIEQRLKAASPLIAQACAIGDGRPYLSALLVLDPVAATALTGRQAPLSQLVEEDAVLAAIGAAVEHANAELAAAERVRRWALLACEWVPGGELTASMKMRRDRVAARHAAEIEAIYAPAPPGPTAPPGGRSR